MAEEALKLGSEVKVARKGMPNYGKRGVVKDKFEYTFGFEYLIQFDNGQTRRYMQDDLKLYNWKVDGLLRWLST